MRIADYQIKLAGQSLHKFSLTRNERLSMWADDKRLDLQSDEQLTIAAASSSMDRVRLSQPGLALSKNAIQELIEEAKQAAIPAPANTKESAATPDDLDQVIDPIFKIKILILEKMFGRKFILPNPNRLAKDRAEAEAEAHQKARSASGGQAAPAAQREGWGLTYDAHSETKEVEKASFSAGGVIKTSDGKEVNFQIDLEMSRERITVENFSLRAGDALKDPLVINFDGTAAELTDQKYSFDLNNDGAQEQISFVKAGHGFLMLDRNGDGLANNGSELFGPTSGNGFQELAQYDEDGNGWVDENDSVYNQLRVWTKDGDQQDQLFNLKDANVGAIYLNNAATNFALKDAQDETQGAVRSTGVYVTEQGQVGTVQQVDLKT